MLEIHKFLDTRSLIREFEVKGSVKKSWVMLVQISEGLVAGGRLRR